MDARFFDSFDAIDTLVAGVDVDDLDDIETLIMMFLNRPLSVVQGWDDQTEEDGVEVIVDYQGARRGTLYTFPLSVAELARGSAEVADEVGPFEIDGGLAAGTPGLAALTDTELNEALTDALGKVRLYNLLHKD